MSKVRATALQLEGPAVMTWAAPFGEDHPAPARTMYKASARGRILDCMVWIQPTLFRRLGGRRRGFFHVDDVDVEGEILAGEGMIDVHHYRVALDLDHLGLLAVLRAKLGTDFHIGRHILFRHRHFFLFIE